LVSEPVQTQTFPIDPNAPTRAPQQFERSPALRPGSLLDRYVIEECIGEGGMGVVYRGRDPKLHRSVAIKLLHPYRLGNLERAQARMVREAQTLAQLQHPNVVTVYDVAAEDNRIFLVMELVSGQTLKEWLKAKERSVKDIVKVFAAAGHGLCAAHAAGIVHRDFKPGNVLVTDSGRVCVTDFGIAFAERLGSVEGEEIAGTPAYMAPEQLRGEKANAAIDQYGFCVALDEALGNNRPRRLDKLIARGMAENPADRFPSMAALVATLEGTFARRARWAFTLALGAAATIAFFAGTYRSGRDRASACASGADKIAATWNSKRANSLQAALGLFGPGDIANRVTRTLNDYETQWRGMYKEACQATHQRGEQSESLLAQRMSCLDRRRREFAAVLDVVSQPAVTPSQALQATSSLPTLAACADVNHLTGIPAIKPEQKAEVEELEDRVARAHALYMLGDFEEGLELAESALLEARGTEYPPLIADALITVGAIHQRLGNAEQATDAWYEAGFVAETARQDRTVADARAWLIFPVGFDLGRTDEALRVAQGTRAALDKIGGDDEIAARYYDHLGSVTLDGLGETRKAIELYEKSLPLNRRVFGNDHLKVSLTMQNIGYALRRIGKAAESARVLRDAIAMTDRALGKSSYQIIMMADLILAESDAGRFTAAKTTLAEARKLMSEVREAPRYLEADLNRAEAELELAQGELDKARTRALLALGIYAEEGLELSPFAVATQGLLGRIALAQGQPALAEQEQRRSLELAADLWGPDSVGAGVARAQLADAQLRAGRVAEALETAQAAIESMGEARDAPQELALAHIVSAEAYLAAGKRDDAAIQLKDARASLAGREDAGALRARADLDLATLLWQNGQRGAAVFMAAASSLSVPDPAGSKLAQSRRWLKNHRL
jgi:tRNA A-37 threonylcarbamoyl transferase component Bud32/tetratricopeptide (TPR) repeat protein